MALVLRIRDSGGSRRILDLFRNVRMAGFAVVDVFIHDAELVGSCFTNGIEKRALSTLLLGSSINKTCANDYC